MEILKGMNDFEIIKSKLERFIKKYYTNELIKGCILFVGIGVLYFIITLLIEYYFWLHTTTRTLLFWLFIVVEIGLFVKFIVFPLLKLLKLSSGIDQKEASVIIGNHFPNVDDKLLNLLQLSHNISDQSALLQASIAQKSNQLKPIPFTTAIDFKKNRKYLKYIAIPALLFLMINFIAGKDWFTNSYTRVVNYNVAYEPPAPFQYFISNDSLEVLEGENYKLQVFTKGSSIPETVSIHYLDEVYFLEKKAPGVFEYTFVQPKESIPFYLTSDAVQSREYSLKVVAVPMMIDLVMDLQYPSYTKKRNEQLKSTGNVTVAEGTRVIWKVATENTDRVQLKTADTLYSFDKEDKSFHLEKKLIKNFNYQISTSNQDVEDYENLSFSIRVIKDQYPEMKLSSKIDSITKQSMYFYGRVSDDYGLRKVHLVYYPEENVDDKKQKEIAIKQNTFDEFISIFPGDLSLDEGINYQYYFEVFDNDAINGSKSSKSAIFNYRKLTEGEKETENLNQQKETISGMSKSLKNLENQQEDLNALNKIQKEKPQLSYTDKKKLENFIEKQKKEIQKLQDFSKNLKKNLEELEEKKKEEPFKDALKEMMERNEAKLKKNEQLLKEIEELSKKLDKEELSEKLDELNKENKNSKKNLEQLLELTKRFYVIEKHEKLGDQLKKLAEKQEKLSEEPEEKNTKEKQDSLNEEFKKFQKEMEQLRKDNEALQKPMNLDQKKEDEESIEKEQNKASENLEKKNTPEAKKNQKSAAQKMKNMQQSMQMQMQASGAQQQQEDAEMLRQILDNLVDFSLEQEELMDDFEGINVKNPEYSKKLRKQSVLKENFIHIDDSLYSLALRTPKISDIVTDQLADVEFNIDKSLERFAENQIIQGVANQQYTITGSNELAYMLSKALEQMQNSMPQSGSGKSKQPGQGFQLPDIIKKQEDLNEQMKGSMEKGKQKGENNPGDKEGEKGKDAKGNGKKGGDQKESKGEGKGKGKPDQKGKEGSDGNDTNGEQEGSKLINEEMNGELFEIYKQQQSLRKALENEMKKQGGERGLGQNLLNKMEQVEQQLLNQGFEESTLKKMLELKHELFKLKEASFEQGKEERRESMTNKKTFQNTQQNTIQKAKQYFNTTEILNRQVLPLQQNYKIKVQEYFKESDD